MKKENQEVITMNSQIEKVSDETLLSHLENLGLTKDLTPGEKDTYMQICKAYNLNPFKREIHVSKYNGVMSIITGYETYIKRAERSGLLDGWNVTTEGSAEKGDLKAIITIHRKDRSKPFVWEVLYIEYVQVTRDNRVTKFWSKAVTMTKKVAMAQGFRLCFNDELGGMPYTPEEMPERTEDVVYETVKTEVKKEKQPKAKTAPEPDPEPQQEVKKEVEPEVVIKTEKEVKKDLIETISSSIVDTTESNEHRNEVIESWCKGWSILSTVEEMTQYKMTAPDFVKASHNFIASGKAHYETIKSKK
jgi:phage recombination protein Bet